MFGLSSMFVMSDALFNLKVASESDHSEYKPPIRDFCLGASILIAVIVFGVINSEGACWSYADANGRSFYVDCGGGPFPC